MSCYKCLMNMVKYQMYHLYINSIQMQTISFLTVSINKVVVVVMNNILVGWVHYIMIHTQQKLLMVQYKHSYFLWFSLSYLLYLLNTVSFELMIMFMVVSICFKAIIYLVCHYKDSIVPMFMMLNQIQKSSYSSWQCL